jgi:TusA-related sulfurtransferase
MACDDVIEVWLDFGAPIENVPSSVVQLGHKIVSREKCDGFWKIQIVKKEVD